MKKFLKILLVSGLLFSMALSLSSQIMMNIGQSSEWEATAYNNGRRVVRDCSMPFMGYIHHVWHSQEDPNLPPSGSNCHVFYACTDHWGNIVIPPTNMTVMLKFYDCRYPSIAIENDGIDNFGDWRNYNTLNVVFQGKKSQATPYDVFHARIPVGNPPTPPAIPWPNVQNLSMTPKFDSIVPAIAINKYTYPYPSCKQHKHVVWQEEDINNGFSDILYTRSVDSGATWYGPQTGGLWDNITNTDLNSQMPSISCILDVFYGFPLDYSGWDCDYDSNYVYVAYNEDTPPGGVNIYYLMSPSDGFFWNPLQNITMLTGGDEKTKDGYPSIAADMRYAMNPDPYLSYAHIVFMRNVEPHSPDPNWVPGIDPTQPMFFPGPDPGMYNMITNEIVYWTDNPTYNPLPPLDPIEWDREFPTVALDRELHVTINWQEYQEGHPYFDDNYEIMRIWNWNNNMPPNTRPLFPPTYAEWSEPVNDSQDPEADDLFPNLAHKKVASWMFMQPPPFQIYPGFTEIWTKILGLGPDQAMWGGPKDIFWFNYIIRDPAVN
jgi:hypothetical protein